MVIPGGWREDFANAMPNLDVVPMAQQKQFFVVAMRK